MNATRLVMIMRFPKNRFASLALTALMDLRVETSGWE